MNLMKLLFLAFTLCMLSSCGDDEECLVLADTIIGTWSSSLLGDGNFEFRADGTLDDPNDLVISGELNGISLDNKTWSLDGNTLTTTASGPAGSLGGDLEIVEFSCDEMTGRQFGINIIFKRQ